MANSSIRQYLALGAIGAIVFAIFQNKVKLCRQDAPNHPAESIEYVDKLFSSGKGVISQVDDESERIAYNRHEAKEEDYWFLTKWAAIVAATGAVIAAVFAAGAFYEAFRQANAAEEGNRPWLRVKSITVESIEIRNGKAGLFYSIEIENSGHDAGTRVYADVTQPVSVDDLTAHFRDWAKFLCQKSKTPDDYLGIVAFPSAPTYFPSAKSIEIPTSKDARENYNTRIEGCLLHEDEQHKPHRTSFSFSLVGLNLTTTLKPSEWPKPYRITKEPTYAD